MLTTVFRLLSVIRSSLVMFSSMLFVDLDYRAQQVTESVYSQGCPQCHQIQMNVFDSGCEECQTKHQRRRTEQCFWQGPSPSAIRQLPAQKTGDQHRYRDCHPVFCPKRSKTRLKAAGRAEPAIRPRRSAARTLPMKFDPVFLKT